MAITLTRVPLTSSLDAAAEARAILRDALRGEPQDTIDRGAILVDEIVASALVSVGAPVELVLERRDDRLVVEVIDAAPLGADPAPDRLGIATTMLDAWASDWGAVVQPGSTSVWFSRFCRCVALL